MVSEPDCEIAPQKHTLFHVIVALIPLLLCSIDLFGQV